MIHHPNKLSVRGVSGGSALSAYLSVSCG